MTITKSGELAFFYTVNKAPVKHLRVYFSPKQAGEGDPSPDNVREIEGWDGIRLKQTGKNLFGGNALKNALKTGFINGTINDTTITYEMDSDVVDLVPLFTQFKSNTQYTFIYTISTSAKVYSHLGILYTDGSYVHLDISNYPGSNIKGTYIKTSNASKSIAALVVTRDTFSSVTFYYNESGIFEGNINIDQFEPYRGQTYSLNWSNDIGTIYGGYVDLVTGELVQEWFGFNAADANGVEFGSQTSDYVVGRIYPSSSGLPSPITSNIISNNFSLNIASGIPGRMSWYNNRIFFGMPGADFENNADASAVRKWFFDHNTKIVYKLTIPITHQLTPAQLQTFIGQNNIWSNADRVEVEYDLAESNDELYRRRNIILSGYPHIETVSGNIVNFQTDMVAPLKEAKVYFEPTQEGEGDPSPNNVRNIYGKTSLNTFVNGVTLPIEYQEVDYLFRSKEQNGPWCDINLPLVIGDIITTYTKPIDLVGEQAFAGTNKTGTYVELYYQNNTKKLRAYVNNLSLISGDGEREYGDIYDTLTVKVLSDFTLMRLGAYSTTAYQYNGKIYGMNITGADGNLKYMFIPCYRKSDNEPGFYEIINNIFYQNTATTGTFVIGNEINGTTHNISWASSGTIYGGYIDVISGQLIQTWFGTAINRNTIPNMKKDSVNTEKGYIQGYFINSSHGIPKMKAYQGISNRFKCMISSKAEPNSFITFTTNTYFMLPLEEVVTQDAAGILDWFDEHPTFWAAEMDTPITHQLSPQTLKTLRGQNNIWSNANGPIEVKYWTH